MIPEGGRPPTQNLGAWVMSLRSGDACPWCGGSLSGVESLERPERREEKTRAENPVDGQAPRSALICRRCGCEVEAPDDTGESGDRELYRAA